VLTFIGFILTIGILVLFHELGHYVVARICGVKVITFSIGFGPKLLSIHTKSNEWCVSLIPLGGYVRMLDAREGAVSANEKHLAFNYKKPYQKILIALAGPLFNLLFAFIAYYVLSITGVPELKPVISGINPELTQINQINIVPGSKIIKINGENVYTWSEADKVFNTEIQKSPLLSMDLEYANHNTHMNLSLTKAREHFNHNLHLNSLGLYPIRYLPIIAYIEPDSPAMKSGLRLNDEIVSINNKTTNNWFLLTSIVQNSPGQLIDLGIRRDKRVINIKIMPDSIENDGQIAGRLGIMPTVDMSLLSSNSLIHKYSMLGAFTNAAASCYAVLMLNLTSIYSIISGHSSVHNLGGPISIARAAHGALANGYTDFINFLALISIGLGIMNLLPLPVLDGGHILIYTLEWFMGREVTYHTQNIIFKIGLVLIIGITMLAFYNDILRL
jgi:regulator of sigma E protease